MAKAYKYSELVDLWVKAGGSVLYAPIAAAVALAESGGKPDAINTNRNGSVDRGLWQINSVHGKQSTVDPVNNAKAAVAISKGGTDWRPWAVAWDKPGFQGQYMGSNAPATKFLPAGNNNVGTVPIAGNRAATIPVPGPSGVFGSLFGSLFGTAVGAGEDAKAQLRLLINSFWQAFGYIILVFSGASMMIVGLVLLILNTRTVRRVGGFAADVGGQALIYRSIIPDTPVNVNVAQPATGAPEDRPVTASDPFSGPPPGERPALEPPLTPVPGALPAGSSGSTQSFDLDATETTGGGFVAQYRRPRPGPS